ncbi:RNA pyrophosphohydrolase [Aurantiacibacter xanthus]|uniref:RNA pyrophosphohydrolase n=1 Tax=Aurantiacibacter xanthus TaxID=1784712 RepID=A0A3A1P655_9SPHN|nr:RNA pyrophosphohydrolase [Aurantiacibacter xanthus]RIV89521.1 RNA pyrophosphohydrolase [Aurantiacibacter xanthus]
MSKPDPTQYRPCVGTMLINAEGRVFVGKRIDTKEGDWWQMPQGGVDEGEDLDRAMLRELHEETGLTADKVAIVARMEEELFYDLPAELKGKLWKGRYVGQRQRWYCVRLTGSEADIDLEAHSHPEFSDWKWIEAEQLPAMIIPFKKPIYEKVVAAFSDYTGA